MVMTLTAHGFKNPRAKAAEHGRRIEGDIHRAEETHRTVDGERGAVS